MWRCKSVHIISIQISWFVPTAGLEAWGGWGPSSQPLWLRENTWKRCTGLLRGHLGVQNGCTGLLRDHLITGLLRCHLGVRKPCTGLLGSHRGAREHRLAQELCRRSKTAQACSGATGRSKLSCKFELAPLGCSKTLYKGTFQGTLQKSSLGFSRTLQHFILFTSL